MAEVIQAGFDPEGWNRETGIMEQPPEEGYSLETVFVAKAFPVQENLHWDPKTGTMQEVPVVQSDF